MNSWLACHSSVTMMPVTVTAMTSDWPIGAYSLHISLLEWLTSAFKHIGFDKLVLQ